MFVNKDTLYYCRGGGNVYDVPTSGKYPNSRQGYILRGGELCVLY